MAGLGYKTICQAPRISENALIHYLKVLTLEELQRSPAQMEKYNNRSFVKPSTNVKNPKNLKSSLQSIPQCI